MVNRGIKSRLGLQETPGRPKGVFKNPYGVPAQEYYKIIRQKLRQEKNQSISQTLQQQQRQIAYQGSPEFREQRATAISDFKWEEHF